jgi:hypothetical protein
MKRFLSLSLALVVSGGKAGKGEEACTAQNGDVNADGRVELTDAVALLGYLFLDDPQHLPPLCEASRSTGLPDTGQDECSYLFTDGNWRRWPCLDGEGICPGQDAQIATGCPKENRFHDNGDGTVSDACTGLMWQKDTASVNSEGEPTLSDRIDWCQSLSYCDNLSLAGYSDWRLPNIRELQSIVDYGSVYPAIDEEVFGVFPTWYWSSTSTADDPSVAWYVNFLDGFVFRDEKSFNLHVRAVRGS